MNLLYRVTSTLTLILLLHAQLLAAEPLSAKKRYLSRDIVDSPAVGVSFLLPRHFRGSYDTRTGLFFMKNRDGLLIGVKGFSEATQDEVSAATFEAAKKMGVKLMRESEENLDPNTTLAQFTTQSASGPGVMVHIAEMGKAGNALAMMAFGKPEHKERIIKKVMRVMARVEWREPEHSHGPQTLAGKILTNNGEPQMTFCKDGRFHAHTDVFSLFSNATASAQNRRTEALSGTWRQTANLVGEALLLLQAPDDQMAQWPMHVTETQTTINNTVYTLRPAKICP